MATGNARNHLARAHLLSIARGVHMLPTILVDRMHPGQHACLLIVRDVCKRQGIHAGGVISLFPHTFTLRKQLKPWRGRYGDGVKICDAKSQDLNLHECMWRLLCKRWSDYDQHVLGTPWGWKRRPGPHATFRTKLGSGARKAVGSIGQQTVAQGNSLARKGCARAYHV